MYQELLTVKEAAQKLGKSVSTIRKEVKKGYLNTIKRGWARFVIEDEKFNQWKARPRGRPPKK